MPNLPKPRRGESVLAFTQRFAGEINRAPTEAEMADAEKSALGPGWRVRRNLEKRLPVHEEPTEPDLPPIQPVGNGTPLGGGDRINATLVLAPRASGKTTLVAKERAAGRRDVWDADAIIDHSIGQPDDPAWRDGADFGDISIARWAAVADFGRRRSGAIIFSSDDPTLAPKFTTTLVVANLTPDTLLNRDAERRQGGPGEFGPKLTADSAADDISTLKHTARLLRATPLASVEDALRMARKEDTKPSAEPAATPLPPAPTEAASPQVEQASPENPTTGAATPSDMGPGFDNPDPATHETGVTIMTTDGKIIRVLKRTDESPEDAVTRVMARHPGSKRQ